MRRKSYIEDWFRGGPDWFNGYAPGGTLPVIGCQRSPDTNQQLIVTRGRMQIRSTSAPKQRPVRPPVCYLGASLNYGETYPSVALYTASARISWASSFARRDQVCD